MAPNATNCMPPKKRVTTIKDVHPIGTSLVGTRINTNQKDIRNPINEKNKPRIDASLSGATEKPVAICIQRLSNLRNV